jgi:hypothetical protein
VATLMNLVRLIVAGSLGSSLLVTALLGEAAGPEVVLGMLGPLAAVTVSWVLMARAHRRDPASVTALMIKAFAVKMVFFGAYVVVVVGVLDVRPVVFVASFTGYFLTLYFVEAVLLSRQWSDGLGASRQTLER